MAMAMAMSVSARKRGRDQRTTTGVGSSVDDFRYESERLREWLEFQKEYLLNQYDEFDEEQAAANSDRLSEIIKSLQDEIGIPARSAPLPPELYASSQRLPFRIRPEEDASTFSEKANSNSAFNCHSWDLKASKARGIALSQPRAGKQNLMRFDGWKFFTGCSFSVAAEPQTSQDEVERSSRTGAK